MESMFLDRDLSWLSFNFRVLMEAQDKTVPLLERLKFAAIYSSNLDEFTRVRVASIRHLVEIDKKKINKQFGTDPEELLSNIHDEIDRQLGEYGRVLNEIIEELNKEGIRITQHNEEIPDVLKPELNKYFMTSVLGHLRPHIFGVTRAKPFLNNRGLYFAVSLEKEGEKFHGYLNIPSDEMNRFYLKKYSREKCEYIFLDDIIRMHISTIFKGYKVLECRSVKLNKDADLHIDDEFNGDLVSKIEKQVKKRNLGVPSRFLYDGEMSKELLSVFTELFGVDDPDLYKGGRYHNLNDYFQIGNPTGNDKLTFDSKTPALNPNIEAAGSVLKAMEEKDQLLSFPYQSYGYILQFFNEAAIDPEVKEINVTFYRMAQDSQIGHALISAANNGKKVRVFMEVKARFDEENNLLWGKRMKKAGVKIVYSMPGLKVHAKVALVKKKTADGRRINYGFFGTGNLNESTAKIYCDHGLLSCDKNMTKELSLVFRFLNSKKKPSGFKELIVSQFDAFKAYTRLIDREIKNAKDGKQALLIIKLNNLEERGLIEKLYEAASEGVEVKLLVRSICCLKPGIGGLKVLRIVDRYLEHARVLYFHNDGNEEVYLGSSDWMSRNIFRRVEVMFPVKDPVLRKQVMDLVHIQLSDNTKAVYFEDDYSNKRVEPEGDQIPVQAQEAIYNYIHALTDG